MRISINFNWIKLIILVLFFFVCVFSISLYILGFRLDDFIITNQSDEYTNNSDINCRLDKTICDKNQDCVNDKCVPKSGCDNTGCPDGEQCVENKCVQQKTNCSTNPLFCDGDHECIDGWCEKKAGCFFDNPRCSADHECEANHCIPKQGCSFTNPSCPVGLKCENNKCIHKDLTNQKSSDNCYELIPGYNDENERRLNIVFQGIDYDSIADVITDAVRLIDLDGQGIKSINNLSDEPTTIFGLFGTEPYKSNKDKFNFWFKKEINSTDEDSYTRCEISPITKCRFENEYSIALENYFCGILGHSEGQNIRVSTKDDEGNYFTDSPVHFIHEMAHSIALIWDTYPEFNKYPNAASNIEEAQNWWSDQIGDGCGQSEIIDCREGDENYYVEVGYITPNAENCFDGHDPIYGCQLNMERLEVKVMKKVGGISTGKITKTNIAFNASTRAECKSSDKHCMFKEYDRIICSDKNGIHWKDTCENFTNPDMYEVGETTYAYTIEPRTWFRPHLFSAMQGGYLGYGPVNEKHICSQMKEKLDSVGGVCSTYGY